jgi:hypothetical protein
LGGNRTFGLAGIWVSRYPEADPEGFRIAGLNQEGNFRRL